MDLICAGTERLPKQNYEVKWAKNELICIMLIYVWKISERAVTSEHLLVIGIAGEDFTF